jgi:hypothetical protein
VKEEKGKVVPLPPGETLIDFLRAKHSWVIDYELTSRMEAFLDRVVENTETWQRFCKGVHNKMGFSIPPARSVAGGPSDAQVKYATHLAAKHGLTIPEATLKSGRELSQLISELVAKGASTPAPSS